MNTQQSAHFGKLGDVLSINVLAATKYGSIRYRPFVPAVKNIWGKEKRKAIAANYMLFSHWTDVTGKTKEEVIENYNKSSDASSKLTLINDEPYILPRVIVTMGKNEKDSRTISRFYPTYDEALKVATELATLTNLTLILK